MQENDALEWIKAEASAANADCVELARKSDKILVRDSKSRNVKLEFTLREMNAFFIGVRGGEFDRLLEEP